MGVFIFIFGACLGSFAMAQVWRMRARQLKGKKRLDSSEQAEYTKLKKILGLRAASDRSVCLHCGKRLKWFELLPVASWLVLRGRCSKCKKKIGASEFLSELALGAGFVGAYVCLQPSSGFDWLVFAVWLVLLATLTVLFIYDLKWSLMPSRPLYFSVVCAMIILICNILQGSLGVAQIPSLLLTLAILPGLYLTLYAVSRGKWVGSGDWILALGLALVLQNYFLALIALFSSNLLGCAVYCFNSAMSKGKIKLAKMPFGPLLIIGTVVALTLKDSLAQILPL